jgi:hypothetical protein
MGFIEDISRALWPHTQHMTNQVGGRLDTIAESLHEIKRQGDIGRPDTGDVFKFFIFKGKAKGIIELGEMVKAGGEPTLGEDWLVQSLAVNGVINKSPGFALRTNTGRLIIAIVAEGMGSENIGGDVVIKQGEQILFEAEAEGTFDFTLTVIQRKYFRPIMPTAGAGISGETYDPRTHATHEPERDFSPISDHQLGV